MDQCASSFLNDHRHLFIVHCSSSIVHRPLFIVHYSSSAIHRSIIQFLSAASSVVPYLKKYSISTFFIYFLFRLAKKGLRLYWFHYEHFHLPGLRVEAVVSSFIVHRSSLIVPSLKRLLCACLAWCLPLASCLLLAPRCLFFLLPWPL